MLQARLLFAFTRFCLSWAAWTPPCFAGRPPAGKARLARQPQAPDGGADVSKFSCQGHRAKHDMAEPLPRALQRRAARPILVELAGSSAAGAPEPRHFVATTNGPATAMIDSADYSGQADLLLLQAGW